MSAMHRRLARLEVGSGIAGFMFVALDPTLDDEERTEEIARHRDALGLAEDANVLDGSNYPGEATKATFIPGAAIPALLRWISENTNRAGAGCDR
ncbi:MAG: hypothetical protein AAGA74_20475 [Pseudomonadota bacterium]